MESVYCVKYLKISKSNMIIVKFINFDTKLKLLTAKKNRKVTVDDIPSVPSLSDQAAREIFINTHVTPFVGRLLHRGRIAVKEKKLAACWMSANSVLIKTSNDGDPMAIKSMVDFDKILGVSTQALKEPNAVVVGKRRMVEISPTFAEESQPKSRARSNVRGRNGTVPLSTENNREKIAPKAKIIEKK